MSEDSAMTSRLIYSAEDFERELAQMGAWDANKKFSDSEALVVAALTIAMRAYTAGFIEDRLFTDDPVRALDEAEGIRIALVRGIGE